LVTIFLSGRGYDVLDVLEASTGRQQIETAVSEHPKSFLLAVRLPDINGLEVARELRKLPQTEHVPIVGWTADCRSSHREKTGGRWASPTVWESRFQ
jgi:CheY-like chemotaxis protein